MTRPVKRLFDLEIDEISLVDRPANQHGLVAIAKRDEDTMPGIFDPDGNPVAEDALEPGAYYYDEDGNEYQFVVETEDDTSAELQSGHNYQDEDERELATVGKSFGGSVYEALSKALTDDDRNVVVSKMAERVSKAEARAAALEAVVSQLAEERELTEYVELAKSYNLPVEPTRLGRILKSASTMPAEDQEELHRLLSAQGELYNELGSQGSFATSAIMDQVQAIALETVGKADVSVEQATVALFEANPAAYDEYLMEG